MRNDDAFGILKLTLKPRGYAWRFIHEPGKTFTDSGSSGCH
jgi:acid phosphatase type 7